MNKSEKIEQQETLQSAVEWVEHHGFIEVKADILEDYEDPKKFVRTSTQDTFVPDITAYRFGRKNFFDIGLKTDKKKRLISKWKLLSTLAAMAKGKLYLLVPRGSFRFVKDTIQKHKIFAEVVKLS